MSTQTPQHTDASGSRDDSHDASGSRGDQRNRRQAAQSSAFVLRDYALLADGERGALVDPHGAITWLCAPEWDSPPVLAGLIGGPGRYQICPADRFVWGGWYEPGSLIWHSRWVTDQHTVIESREALAYPGTSDQLVLLRRISVEQDSARVRLTFELPAAPLDQAATDLHRDDDGAWTVRLGSLHARFSTRADDGQPLSLDVAGGMGEPLVLSAEFPIRSGAPVDLVLQLGTGPLGPPVDPDAAWQRTEQGWSERVPRLSGVFNEGDARHSAAVLCGLTANSGAMVAAATTGLPERGGNKRNYDYRYAWIRDQAYAGHAAFSAGIDSLGDSAVQFVTKRLLADGAGLRPAYTVRGEQIPAESKLSLPGYPGGQDVVGNAVSHQHQLDNVGEALFLLATAAQRGRLDDDGVAAAERAVDAVAQRWDEPEAGVWELSDKWWIHSRLAVTGGLRAWVSAGAGSRELAQRAGSLADTVLSEAMRRGTHPSGRWQRAPNDERVDAALLIGGLRGVLPPEDRRTSATLAAVQSELDVAGYIYRYKIDDRPLGQAEGAFLLCSYWTALAEAQAGQHVGAIRRLERALGAAGSPTLFSEEYDTSEHQLRGNLPQAFVHALALATCAELPRLMPEARPLTSTG